MTKHYIKIDENDNIVAFVSEAYNEITEEMIFWEKTDNKVSRLFPYNDDGGKLYKYINGEVVANE